MKPPIVRKKRGPKPGPRLVVMTGVHGNEKVGPLMFDSLEDIDLICGELVLIIANPSALEENKRYINTNLNRRFGKQSLKYPEDAIAREIEGYLDEADGLLDIHSYNEDMDRPFLITNPISLGVARQLPVEYVTTGWSAFDAGSSESYMNEQGKIGICFECGSSNRPKAYKALAEEVFRAFLKGFGLLTGATKNSVEQKHIEVFELVKKRHNDFAFAESYQSFDSLTAGRKFASMGDKDYVADQNELILFPRSKARLGDEVFIRARIV